MLDLDRYLARIAWQGPLTKSVETLGELALAHAIAIPFENLNPLLGLPVPLDLPSLQRKLVDQGRGGYCYEHNLLFAAVLRRIGFEPQGLAARVLWNQPEDRLNPRTHMLLQVPVDGRAWIVDVGFGGLTLTGALALQVDDEQPTPHEPFRLVLRDGDWFMQALLRGEWKTLYRFDLLQHDVQDYEIPNYYLATHPRSHFVTGLMAARAAPDRRFALANRSFAVHHLNGETERRTLNTAAEMREVLQQEFLISLPDHPRLDERLENLPSP
jgi:N-hydroxyarylamine O-acetyltransferase